MADEVGFHVARAYVTVEPDTADFPEKLKADLEKYDYKLKIPVSPDMANFPAEVQAGLDASKDEVGVKVEPDPGSLADFSPKVAAALGHQRPVDVPLSPDMAGFLAKMDLGRIAAYISDTFGHAVESSKVGLASSAMLTRINDSLADSFGSIQTKAAGAALSEKALASINESLAESYLKVGVAEKIAAEQAGSAAAHQALLTAATATSVDATLGLARATAMNAALTKAASGTTLGYALANAALGASAGKAAAGTSAAGTAAGTAANTYRLWGTGIRLTGTAMHGLVSGLVELAAVVIPATVAGGAWAAAWAEGAGNVYEHMQAVYTATEATANMFHETAGQALGLGDALQKAQTDVGDGQVYIALGGALNVARESMGGLAQQGLKVGGIFDNFMAKLVYDFSSAGGAGKTLSGLLSNMVPDLTELGEVFGNLGSALGGFAAQMPGLADLMLEGLAGATKLISGLVSLSGRFKIAGASALTLVMAFHEFNTWGSIAVAALGKMGLASSEVAGGFFSLQRAGGVLSNLLGVLPMLFAKMTAGFGGFLRAVSPTGSAVDRLGVNIAALGSDAEEAAAGMGLLELGIAALGVAAAVGIGILIDKMVTAKSAAQSFADSIQSAVDKASNLQVFNTIAAGMAKLTTATTQGDAAMRSYAKQGAATSGALESVGHFATQAQAKQSELTSAYNNSRAAVQTYTAEQKQLQQQFIAVGTHASALAGQYHTTLPGAMALATEAGVHLNQTMSKQAWAMAQIKIADLVAGYGAMGQSAGAVGADMTVLAISSALAATKVSALNQAEDEFMANVTGGTSALGSYVESIQNIGHVAGDTANHLSSTTGGMVLSTRQFASSLKTDTGVGAQAWANFGQAIGQTAPQVIDWLRTAGAEGAITKERFSKAVLDMASSMIPFAEKSRAAQSDVLAFAKANGITAQSFPQLVQMVKDGHASIGDMSKQVLDATIKMGNMSAVAQALGNVMPTVTAAMNNARVAASGVAADTVKYTQDIRDNTQFTAAGHADRQKLYSDLLFVTGSAKTASAIMRTYTGNVENAGGASQAASGKILTLAQALARLHSKSITVRVNTEESNHITQIVSRLTAGGGAAAGAVIPGYAPGVDDRLIAVGPGEGILVPEAVRGLGGPAFVHAANRKFGGPRVARGNKTGRFAAGGITETAHFGFPQDVFNFTLGPFNQGSGVWGVGGGSGTFSGFSELARELKGFKTAGAAYPGQSAASYARWEATVKADNKARFAQMETDGKKLVAAFSEGTLTTVSAIKSEAATAIRELGTYYSGPAATRLEATITRQTAAMEKLAAASAKVSATIAGMKAFSAQEVSSLQSFSDLSAITGTTNATTGATNPVTGAQIQAGLRKDLAQLRQFEAIIKELKRKKVASSLIEQVIALGPVAGIQYGQAILSGGSSLIAEINKTEKAISGEETVIGHTAAEIQYGQSISKGFLSGLDKQQAAIDRKMLGYGDKIAQELAKALGVPEKTLEKDEKEGRKKLAGEVHKKSVPHKMTPPHIIEPTGGKMHPDVHVTINLNGSKGKLSPEEISAIKHEISAQLALSH